MPDTVSSAAWKEAVVGRFGREPRIVLGPLAGENLAVLHALGDAGALPFPPSGDVWVPAVHVLVPGDLRGRQREALLEAVLASRPVRPVLVGGAGYKDVLLEAINVWRVCRVVPEGLPPAALAEAVTYAVSRGALADAFERALEELRSRTSELERALADLRGAQSKLLEGERQATLGRVSRALAADVRAHLGSVVRFLDAAAGKTPDPELVPLIERLRLGGESLTVRVSELHAFAERRETPYACIVEDLDDLVERAIGLARLEPIAQARQLETSLASKCEVLGDRHQITHLLLNVIRNACQATSHGQRVTVRSLVDGGYAVVEVEDEGHGMTPEVRARVFEPFFTTREDAMGLGLHMARRSVERHGGFLRFTSEPGKGTTFRIGLVRLGQRGEGGTS